MLTERALKKAVPRVAVKTWLDPINVACERFDIRTPRQLAGFLGQCAHESMNFTRLVENMNYSAQRMAEVWPGRFSTGPRTGGRYTPNKLAYSLANNPERLANVVYANRMGNRDADSGDGWRYIGRGLIHLTGRDNYTRAGIGIGMPLVAVPEVVEQPEIASLTAAWFWWENNLNHWADQGNWLALSRAINIGNARSSLMPVGQEHRVAAITRALSALA